jgi:hypothetical protein
MKRNRPHQSEFRFGGEKPSSKDVARFLRGVADLYRDPTWGNPALSQSLYELARNLLRKPSNLKRDKNRTGSSKLDSSSKTRRPFESLDASEISHFLDDAGHSKRQLVELAFGRFGIPRSRLLRLKTTEVRERIRAALLHEDSLHIISEEARRGGAKRSS